ncbi:hypothetical protein [Dysgonomonas sp. BGC7]|uniref:hypothetical protein n=1 Tax=Dysgonomonas sp. BGC7 TaxID=1658008 RepID=UPI000681123E|nr:hypothetical protein [Dysgonomonas sp. BGC7]MBD8387664.1 hypothetical protein [Dysgonomonas sp. BGC7]
MEKDSLILSNAKKDIPIYLQDFNNFWKETTTYYTDEVLTECYATSLIYKNWLIVLNHIGIKTVDAFCNELHEDINTSFYHSYFGQYRSAHMHLRSVIELSLQLFYFYQHEVEYDQWKSGEYRIKHDVLTDYLKKHPAFKDTTAVDTIDLITRKWKLFSKYIHAEAPDFFQTNLESSKKRTISKKDLGVWKSNYLKTGYLTNKLFLLFFKNNLNLFPTQNRDILLRNQTDKDLIELGLKIG